MNPINEWLKRAYEKVRKQRPKEGGSLKHLNTPEGARVLNPYSKRAHFAGCRYRRVGYVVFLSPKHLVESSYTDLNAPRIEWFKNAWLQGVLWTPLRIEAVVEGDRWMVNHIEDYDIAEFLNGKQDMLVAQVVEPGREGGTSEKLELLHKGLYFRDGDHCPVLSARVTL